MSYSFADKSISDQDTFTDWVTVSPDTAHPNGGVVASWNTTSAGTATITLQCKRPSDAAAIWEQTLSTAGRYIVEDPGQVQYRLGVKTGGYTSGTHHCTVETY